MTGSALSDKHIVILGGGTAGWITANAMIDRWAGGDVRITLVESPAIGTVGVGEGSTPRLKVFFDEIGVEEQEWMPACNATYKNGISFVGWSMRPGFSRYFHPFTSEIDRHTATAFYFNTHARRQGVDVHAHPDRFFLAARLSAERLGPKPAENFPFLVEYGYHFDAHRLGEFLKGIATGRGVRHEQANVIAVEQAPDGGITGLVTEDRGTISGDFFVDCSGFRGTLIQDALGVPFLSFAENLFNDSAVVLPTGQGDSIASETVSIAMRYGWRWEIPLTHRIGNGYVYSSSYCTADAAEEELRRDLGLLDSETEARHLRMKVGRVEKHWHRNCLAVGLSQGFIEPLEATALNLVCNTVYDFIETVDAHGFDPGQAVAYNRRVNDGFERIRDYIVAHYIMNSRDDTDYWRDNGSHANVSDTLQTLLGIWKRGESLGQEMERREIRSSYRATSWNCLFSGYGFYPPVRPVPVDHPAMTKVDMAAIDDFIRRCTRNFDSQNAHLARLGRGDAVRARAPSG